ncbi:MAG: hypothetical protein ABIS50_25410 [Luteolibacter sp.]|uniref:hypothetical protein n=1 Tax=Luteolibacter sp. TaxID=1962973 RepID=UPI0032637FE4
MQNDHSAFLGSEYVRVKDAPALAALRERCTTDSPISLHTVFPEKMAEYAGERVQITGISYYHMGFVLYQLRVIGGALINGHWPEEALEDQELGRVNEHEFFGLAADRYFAKASDDGSLVDIRDRADRLLCSLRMRNVPSAVEDINRVAGLRCSFSFARRYNFEDEIPDSHQSVDRSSTTTSNG